MCVRWLQCEAGLNKYVFVGLIGYSSKRWNPCKSGLGFQKQQSDEWIVRSDCSFRVNFWRVSHISLFTSSVVDLQYLIIGYETLLRDVKLAGTSVRFIRQTLTCWNHVKKNLLPSLHSSWKTSTCWNRVKGCCSSLLTIVNFMYNYILINA